MMTEKEATALLESDAGPATQDCCWAWPGQSNRGNQPILSILSLDEKVSSLTAAGRVVRVRFGNSCRSRE